MTVTKEDIKSWLSIPLGQEIIDLLTPIFDNDEFICSALAFCDTEEARRKLINEIKTKKLTKYGDICHTINAIRMGRI